MSYYIHHLPGRLRIRSPIVRRNEGAEKGIFAALGAVAGITSIAIDGRTGSCLIHYDPSSACQEEIVLALSERGYFNPGEAITHDDYMRIAATKFLSLLLVFL